MPAVDFDRDSLAGWYAGEHLSVDPGLREIFYLPKNAPEREIRLLEVNELIGELLDEALEPIDFGIDRGSGDPATLMVLDITPAQWERIQNGELRLPPGWSLESAVRFAKP